MPFRPPQRPRSKSGGSGAPTRKATGQGAKVFLGPALATPLRLRTPAASRTTSPPSLFPPEDEPWDDRDEQQATEQPEAESDHISEMKSYFSKTAISREEPQTFLASYTSPGRFIPRVLGPFPEVREILQIGMRPDGDDGIDAEDDLVNGVHATTFDLSLRGYAHMKNLFPGLPAILAAFEDNTEVLGQFARFLQDHAMGGRATDINIVVHGVLQYFSKVEEDLVNGVEGIDKPERRNFTKERRGWGSHFSARLLCPRKRREVFDEDRDSFCRNVNEGVIVVSASDWPSFLYCEGAYNPEELEDGLLRSPELLKCFRHLFTGFATMDAPPTAGPRSGRKSVSQLVNMTSVSPEHIAYACVLLRHALSAKTMWGTSDNHFNNREFWENIIELFNEPEDCNQWSTSTLQWWNENVFGPEFGNRRRVRTSGTSDLDSLSAQRAARYAAARASRAMPE